MSAVVCPGCGLSNPGFDLECPACRWPLPGAASSWPGPGESGGQADESRAWIGRSLGPYEVQDVLGSGATGVVYRALDVRLRRPVALKVLAPVLAGEPRLRARFLREARAAAALDHPHVGRVHGLDEHEGRPFLIMDLYEGETLARRLERGALPASEAHRLACQIAEGLAAAHAAGVVHRDLKPGNVLLTQAGEVKIVDFGLAKLLVEPEAGLTPLTRTGQVIGTMAYMSPEQVRAEPLDGRSDLWSLGVVLYEMLTGRRPFQAPNAAGVLDAILGLEPASVRELRPDVPAVLEQALRGLLRKRREARIGSARELLQLLG